MSSDNTYFRRSASQRYGRRNNRGRGTRGLGALDFAPVAVNGQAMELLPGAKEMPFERLALGCVLIDSEALHVLRAMLIPDDFYGEAHREIFLAMEALAIKGDPVDLGTVIGELMARGTLKEVGGASYVSEMPNNVPTSLHVKGYCKVIQKAGWKRRLFAAGTQMVALSGEPDLELDETRAQALDLLLKALRAQTMARGRPFSELFDELATDITDRVALKGFENVLPTGYDLWDENIVGFELQQLIVVAARPRMGKSALGLRLLVNIARHLAKTKTGTCDYLTLEMSNLQQMRRLLAAEAEVSTTLMRTGMRSPRVFAERTRQLRDEGAAALAAIDDEQDVDQIALASVHKTIEKLNREIGQIAYSCDEPLDLSTLEEYLATAVAERNLRCVVLDYLDLIDAPGENESEQISATIKFLKQLARDLNICVIVLAQLNRGPDARAGFIGKRPRLSDLRMSGRIEQDADNIYFLYRPVVYDPTNDDPYFQTYAELIAAKVRDATSDFIIPLAFLKGFVNLVPWPSNWPSFSLEALENGDDPLAGNLATMGDGKTTKVAGLAEETRLTRHMVDADDPPPPPATTRGPRATDHPDWDERRDLEGGHAPRQPIPLHRPARSEMTAISDDEAEAEAEAESAGVYDPGTDASDDHDLEDAEVLDEETIGSDIPEPPEGEY